MATDGLYAYGLVDNNVECLDLLGIDKKHKVYAVTGRAIRVVVSKIDVEQFKVQVKQVFAALTQTAGATQTGAEELLQAHEDVVAALMSDTTVVPFPFGTILIDEQAATKMLQDDEEKFTKLLAKFAGREEWGLKVYADQQQLIQQMLQSDPEFQSLQEKRDTLSRGAAYLFGRKMEETVKDNAAARLTEVSGHIFHALTRDAYEAKLNKTLPQKLTGKAQEMILNAVYLVEREKAARFCEHGTRLRKQYASMGLDLQISGPWPPYNFT
jgi:hypothetical protein